MNNMTVLQLIGLVKPKAFVTLEHIDSGLRLNHFQQIPCLIEQFNDRSFFKTFKIIGEIIVPTYNEDKQDVVLSVFTYKTFMENFNEICNKQHE